jgi:hypothetical protein
LILQLLILRPCVSRYRGGDTPGWQPFSKGPAQRVASILEAGQQRGPSAVVDGWLRDPMLAAAKAQPRVIRQPKMLLTQNARGFLGTPLMRPPDIPSPDLANLKIPALVIVEIETIPKLFHRR